MIDKKLIPYGGLKKEPFSGTHHGMRYFFRGRKKQHNLHRIHLSRTVVL